MKKIFLLGLIVISAIACKDSQEVAQEVERSVNQENLKPIKILKREDFVETQWVELIPKSELDALLAPPSYITEIEDGSFEDQISGQIAQAIGAANDDAYQQALVSTTIMPQMNGKQIKIPGFIVPLEFNEKQAITAFFLVPYFGACIHTPPPPPNQLIYVESPNGIDVDVSYDAFWISGVLETSIIENELAKSAYSMKMQYFEIFDEEY